jgi:hypothetical protein
MSKTTSFTKPEGVAIYSNTQWKQTKLCRVESRGVEFYLIKKEGILQMKGK